MLFLDIIDIALFSAYGLVIVGALLAVGFPIYLSSKNPAILKESSICLILENRLDTGRESMKLI